MKNSLLILILVSLIGCTKYDCNDLEYRDGLRYEKNTNILANGHYKCVDIRNGGGSSEHITEYEFNNGLPVGSWTYHAQGQLIQNGEFIKAEKLKKAITKKTKAKVTLVEAWYEGQYGKLNIDIISPQTPLDSINSSQLYKKYALDIAREYKLSTIVFRQKINEEWKYLSYDSE